MATSRLSPARLKQCNACRYRLFWNRLLPDFSHSSGEEETARTGTSIPGVQCWICLRKVQNSYNSQLASRFDKVLYSAYSHWFAFIWAVNYPEILSSSRYSHVQKLELNVGSQLVSSIQDGWRSTYFTTNSSVTRLFKGRRRNIQVAFVAKQVQHNSPFGEIHGGIFKKLI